MAQASFPEVHVTGAIHAFVLGDLTGETEPFYLGTTEVTPQVQRQRLSSEVMNDIKAKKLPFQKTDDLEEHNISLMLTRFSRSAWDNILSAGVAAGRVLAPGGVPDAGTFTRWTAGGLVYGVRTFQLWLLFENFFNPFGASTGLEIGWYYPQVELLNHDMAAGGTQAEKLLLLMNATPWWIPQTSPTAITGNQRGWLLYSNNVTDFPASVQVPQ